MASDWTIFRKTLGAGFIVAGVMWAFAAQTRGATCRVEAAGMVAVGQNATDTEAPQFQNAHVEKRAIRGPLAEELRQWASATTTARWLGYRVEEVKGEREVCCSNWDDSGKHCGACQLEGNRHAFNVNSNGAEKSTVQLEGSRRLVVMYRAENGQLSRIRVVSMDCAVDAGGREVLWLEEVKDSESVAVLVKHVEAEKRDGGHGESLGKSALTAIALHEDASAERALESFVDASRPEWLRRETAFWLGEAQGAEGFRALENMARNDPSANVREQVTFALSVSKEPGALGEMIRMAHDDQSAQVRGQALFWLAQKAGNKAVHAIDGAIQNDPDTEVKKKAVFALSQLPRDEGVPKLIEVAQTNRNAEVRKQAMFWLGQSEDPRALAFFEKVLRQ